MVRAFEIQANLVADPGCLQEMDDGRKVSASSLTPEERKVRIVLGSPVMYYVEVVTSHP